MKYDIIRTPGTLIDLRTMVEYSIQRNGWQPLGAPFYDERERQWCQAMTGPQPDGNDTYFDRTRLREPKRK